MPQSSLLTFFQPTSAQVKNVNDSDGICAAVSSSDSPTIASHRDNEDLVSKSGEGSISKCLSVNSTSTDFVIPPSCPSAIICKIQPCHLEQIKRLTGTLLPVRYPDNFFHECIQDEVLAAISRVAIHHNKPVGWIRCRLEPRTDGTNDLYIQAIGVLAPWRGFGLAVALLEQVTRSDILLQHCISHVYAHVWQSNEDALEWYDKRGFKRLRLEPNYYRRIRPAGAWVMQKPIAVD